MPHAFADVRCLCSVNCKFHCFSRDNDDGYLNDYECEHFRSSVFKRSQLGWLLGFDQLAGLYFNISCLKCNTQKSIFYEAKTFGKKDEDHYFKCCGNLLSFHFRWAH